MNANIDDLPEHTEVDEFERSEPSENPLTKALDVTISIPETIEIRMVDASVLADYEVWFFISSVLASATVGFFVAFLQNNATYLLATSLVFFILLIVSIVMTSFKRHELRKKSKEVKLKATEPKLH